MTQDEIICMAREAGFAEGVAEIVGLEGFERFFNLAFEAGAAHEREKQAEQEPVAWANPHDLERLAIDMKVRACGCPLYTVPLYAALQPVKQEPVCKRCNGTKIVPDGKMYSVDGFQLEVPIECVKDCPDCAAPVRTKDLTADELSDLVFDYEPCENPFKFARAVIAAYKEKNK